MYRLRVHGQSVRGRGQVHCSISIQEVNHNNLGTTTRNAITATMANRRTNPSSLKRPLFVFAFLIAVPPVEQTNSQQRQSSMSVPRRINTQDGECVGAQHEIHGQQDAVGEVKLVEDRPPPERHVVEEIHEPHHGFGQCRYLQVVRGKEKKDNERSLVEAWSIETRKRETIDGARRDG